MSEQKNENQKSVKEKNTVKNKEPEKKVKKSKISDVNKRMVTNVIFIVAVIAIIVLAVILLMNVVIGEKYRENTKLEDNNIEVNISSKVNAERKIDGLKITNIEVSKKDEISYITADVINETKEEKGGFDVYISLLDKDGNEIVGFGEILQKVQPGEKFELNIGSTEDFTNAYDLKITKIDEEIKE